VNVLAARLDTTVSLLGASIETLRGATTGHATIAVSTRRHDLVEIELRLLGLDASRAGFEELLALEAEVAR
jgi:hypothetical protein